MTELLAEPRRVQGKLEAIAFFVENFIEIIIDSHAIVRNNTQGVSLCAICPLPPVVRFCTIFIPEPGC